MGNLWLGTWDGGLHRMDGKTHKISQIKGKSTIRFSGRTASELNIFKITERSPGILWLATWGQGLIAFNIREQVFEEIVPASRIEGFRDLKYGNNQMWAASVSGLIRFDQKNNFEIIPDKSGLFENTSSLCFDRTGILWVGSENGSVGKINFINKNFILFPSQSPLGSLAVNALGKGTEPNQAYAAYSNKLTTANLSSNRTMEAPYGDIASIAVFPGKILTASSQGLAMMEPGNRKLIPMKLNDSLFTNRQIWTIYKETDSTFWLGILGAAVKLTHTKDSPEISEIFFTGTKSGINPSHYPACFLKDSRGNLWIGTFGGGLSMMKPDRTFVSFSNNEKTPQLSDNFVECLLEDRSGNIWIGTHNGLDRYNPVTSTFENYSLTDGLQNTWIASLEEDSNGNIWFSTHGGISCIRKDGDIRNYNIDDGLPSNYFLPRSSARLKNGSLWFGSNHGVVWFFPDSIHVNHHLPQSVITGLSVNNQNSEVIPPIISINDKDFISFQFSALQYFNPKKDRYRYMLKGYDKSWQMAGEDRTANYRYIKPGRYIFVVAASNDDGLWSEKEAQLEILVKRSFPAFTVIIFASVIVLAALAFYLLGFKRKAQHVEVKTGKSLFKVVQPSEVPYSSAEEVFLQKALKIVEENLSDPDFGVEELCYKICISRPQLYRKIQAVAGLSVTEFIKEVRLKRAAQLLKQKPENISEIAYSVGFNDPKYFSKCFKQKFGMSPARFINENERLLPPE
jgi:ligand-binding sensor domain-containing protein/AraC-like DNA-binding protein